jgi:hypothetical protein
MAFSLCRAAHVVHSSRLSDRHATLGGQSLVPTIHSTYDDWLFGFLHQYF